MHEGPIYTSAFVDVDGAVSHFFIDADGEVAHFMDIVSEAEAYDMDHEDPTQDHQEDRVPARDRAHRASAMRTRARRSVRKKAP